jgi:hypothetical protein
LNGEFNEEQLDRNAMTSKRIAFYTHIRLESDPSVSAGEFYFNSVKEEKDITEQFNK